MEYSLNVTLMAPQCDLIRFKSEIKIRNFKMIETSKSKRFKDLN